MGETDITFDLDLWTTDPEYRRDHLIIKDYLPTKFEASGAKGSWVISCTRYWRWIWPLTLAFDLLTCKSVGVIYLLTIYLPSLKLCYQLHKVWEMNMTFDLNINKDHLIIKDYLPAKFEASGAKGYWVISCTRYGRWKWPLTYWPENQ